MKTTLIVLAVFSALVVAGCDDKQGTAKPESVADFLHDLDAAKAVLKAEKAQPGSNSTQAVNNASQAVAQAMSPSMLACWPTKPASTATTDHACLDGKGFKRE